jgi:Kef-type K+ transport system membrane component KefB
LDIKDATLSSVYLPMGLIIGAIASATAPAAVMAIIHEYKASGPLTTTLLAVVAFDDAIAIVLFSIAVGVAQSLVGGQSFSAYQTFLAPLIDIIGSIAIGTAFGFTLAYLTRLIKIKAVMLVLVIGVIVLCVGVTEKFHLSGIMANMVIGFIVCNMTKREDVYLAVDDIEDLVFAIFFVLAGLHFELGVMKTAGLFAVLITISRFAGKYFGVMSGARISGAPAVVRKYLGFALLPKAGVSIGLALLAESAFPSFGNIIFNGILASAIINELFSPLLVKYAIFKAGEQYFGS